jgi:hypothetical protein
VVTVERVAVEVLVDPQLVGAKPGMVVVVARAGQVAARSVRFTVLKSIFLGMCFEAFQADLLVGMPGLLQLLKP